MQYMFPCNRNTIDKTRVTSIATTCQQVESNLHQQDLESRSLFHLPWYYRITLKQGCHPLSKLHAKSWLQRVHTVVFHLGVANPPAVLLLRSMALVDEGLLLLVLLMTEIRDSPVEVASFIPLFSLQGFIHLRWCRISCINRIIGGCMYKMVAWTFFLWTFFRCCKWVHSVHLKFEMEWQKSIKWFRMITESGQYHFQEFWGPLFQKHRNAISATLLKYQLVRSAQIEIIHVSGKIMIVPHVNNPEIRESVILNHLLGTSCGIANVQPNI